MEEIVIPLKIKGVPQAQAQINAVGRQMASLAGGGSRIGGNAQQWNRRQLLPPGWNPRLPGSKPPKLPKPQKPAATFGQKLGDAFMTSRVSLGNGGGQIMPLVNRLMALSPVVTVAATAISVLAKAANDAAENINAFREAQTTGGGTARQTALLTNAGISPQLARQFGRTISSDPLAAGFAGRAGIHNPGGEIFGNTNTVTNLLKWVDALRGMSDTEALRAARITGTEELLKLRDVSNRVFVQMKQDALQTERVMSPQSVRVAADYAAQQMRLNSAMRDFSTLIGQQVIPIVSGGMELLADSIRGWIAIAEHPTVKWLAGMATGAALGPAKPIFDWLSGMGRENGKDARTAATDANTDALKQLTNTLKNGVHGNAGERARGAVPSQWTGMHFDRWASHAMGLGAFEL